MNSKSLNKFILIFSYFLVACLIIQILIKTMNYNFHLIIGTNIPTFTNPQLLSLLYIFIFFFTITVLCKIGFFGLKIEKYVDYIVENHLLELFVIVSLSYFLIKFNFFDLYIYADSTDDSNVKELVKNVVENENTKNISTQSKSSVSVNVGATVDNIQTEAINKIAEAGKTIGEGLKVLGDNMVGLGGGGAALAGAKMGYHLGSRPLQKVGGAMLGASVGLNVYVQSVYKARKINYDLRNEGNSTPNPNNSSSTDNLSAHISGNVTKETSTQTNTNEFSSSLFNNENINILNLDNNTDTINNVIIKLDTHAGHFNQSLLVINSPLEIDSIIDFLNSIIIMNTCMLLLLIIILVSFIEFLIVSKKINIDIFDKVYFGQSIKKIFVKWQNVGIKSILIFIFIWWLIIFIGVFFTIDDILWIRNNFDSIVDEYIKNKSK